MKVRDVAHRVRVAVHELAKRAKPNPHIQTPAYYDGLTDDFCLAGPCTPQPVTEAPPRPKDFNADGPPETCNLGEPIGPDEKKFRIQVLVVEDGPEVRSIISRLGETNQGQALRQAIASGSLKRATGVGTLTIGILGVNQKAFPVRIPYFLGGRRICHGQMPAMGTPDGVEVSIPVGSAQNQGESGIVVSRRHLAASRLQVCVEPSFAVHRSGSIEDAYKHRQNFRCGFLTDRSGTTTIGEALRKGASTFSLILIRREEL
jgi:hypothetical protein